MPELRLPDAPVTLIATLGLAVVSGLVGFVAGLAEVPDDQPATRVIGGLLIVLTVSMLPALLAWFAARGYLLAYVVLVVSALLTLVREAAALPDFPALVLAPIAVLMLGCLLAPVSIRWIREQQPG